MTFRSILAAAALLSSPFALAACGSEAPVEEVAAEGIPGLTVTNARVVLPAVAGNPAAVYMDLAYSADEDRGVAIRRVNLEKAEMAMLHEYVEYDFQTQMVEMMQMTLQPGDTGSFTPGEAHVMATGLADDVKPGDTLNVTLIAAGGVEMTVPAEVLPANAAR